METCRPNSRRLSAIWFLVVTVSQTAFGQPIDKTSRGPLTPEEVQRAWEIRSSSIRSVALKASMDEMRTGSGDADDSRGGPFGKTSKNERIYKVSLDFAVEDGKITIDRFRHPPVKQNGSKEILAERTQRIRRTFDGKRSLSLVVEGDLPFGTIDANEAHRNSIVANADFLAFALWVDPKRLLREIEWSAEDMTIGQQEIRVGGSSCTRLEIARPCRHARWKSAIDVDSAKGCVPRQWQTWLGRRLMTHLVIEYEHDDKVGLVLKSWKHTSYTEGSGVGYVRRGQVTQFAINEDIDDRCFTIEFPIGTHVSENSDKGFQSFIQTNSGLAPLDRDKFGRIELRAQVNGPNDDHHKP